MNIGPSSYVVILLIMACRLMASYDRIQPNTWSGAYQCWGRQNREAPLRTASSPGVPNGFTNFEVKVFDGCANPYLGLASIIAAGIDGLRRRLTLPEPVGKFAQSFYNVSSVKS